MSSKMWGMVGTISFKWESKNEEIFSVAVWLFEMTGRPETFIF